MTELREVMSGHPQQLSDQGQCWMVGKFAIGGSASRGLAPTARPAYPGSRDYHHDGGLLTSPRKLCL